MERKVYPTLSGLGMERVWQPSPLRRVDIVAMGASCLDFVQSFYHQGGREPDHQVWTINSGSLVFQHDLVWNMHDLLVLKEREPTCPYIEVYKKLEKPLVTIRALEELPLSFEFPFGEMLEKFQMAYFANTVCYMIAGALLCGVEEIRIYGADYNYPGKTDYEAGRPGVEFWLGYAKAKGVRVIPGQSTTLLDSCYRLPGMKGAIGYGAIYGYFNSQPELNLEGETAVLSGFVKEIDLGGIK